MLEQFGTFFRRLTQCYKAYGGWVAVFGSPFFIAAVLAAAVNYSGWIEPKWILKAESLIPSLLGFSLGAYALLFSLISNRLKSALRAVKHNGVPWLDVVNATFFHFIFVQVIALLWAFLFSGSALYDVFQILQVYWPNASTLFFFLKLAGSFIGYTLLIYSFLLTIASALVIYRLARIKEPDEVG